MYYLYILRCADGTFYTGITSDIERRLKEHNSSLLGAKYTKGRRPVSLVFSQSFPDRSSALIAEAQLKKVGRIKKMSLTKKRSRLVPTLFRRLIGFGATAPRKVRRKRIGPRRAAYLEHKERARALVLERLGVFNETYSFTWKKICIKDTRTRWGSCSRTGNLNFNYRIVLLPPHLADYIIVHELCHIGEFNHSYKFWDLVAKALPDYRALRAELKKHRPL